MSWWQVLCLLGSSSDERLVYMQDENIVGMGMYYVHIYLFSSKYASLNIQ
jgi:hypothetical protein